MHSRISSSAFASCVHQRTLREEPAFSAELRSSDPVQFAFAQGPHCTAIEHRLNLLMDASGMLAVCERHDLASINRVPLMIGLLTGRWTLETVLPEDDRRSDWFGESDFLDTLQKAEALRPFLEVGGRSYVQGALGWILARGNRTIPIPGFRTVEQVEGVAGTLQHGPLTAEQMAAVARHLDSASSTYA